jgi:uncharacterized protein
MSFSTPNHTNCRTLCTAFEGTRLIASGELVHVALQAKEAVDRGAQEPVLIFDDLSSEVIELDFRGLAEDVLQRLPPAPEEEPATAGDVQRRPGRPKLGVVAREVTLLPRHWEWLNLQAGGASVALRKLVDQARVANAGNDRIRMAQESTYRFLSAMAGNEPGYEEALRALFAGQRERFEELMAGWPADIRGHAKRLALTAFAE